MGEGDRLAGLVYAYVQARAVLRPCARGQAGAGVSGSPMRRRSARSAGPRRSSRLVAAQLAWTCSALVAPNSTLVTAGLVSGNAIASAAAVASSLLARLASSPAAATAAATRGSASVPAGSPGPLPAEEQQGHADHERTADGDVRDLRPPAAGHPDGQADPQRPPQQHLARDRHVHRGGHQREHRQTHIDELRPAAPPRELAGQRDADHGSEQFELELPLVERADPGESVRTARDLDRLAACTQPARSDRRARPTWRSRATGPSPRRKRPRPAADQEMESAAAARN